MRALDDLLWKQYNKASEKASDSEQQPSAKATTAPVNPTSYVSGEPTVSPHDSTSERKLAELTASSWEPSSETDSEPTSKPVAEEPSSQSAANLVEEPTTSEGDLHRELVAEVNTLRYTSVELPPYPGSTVVSVSLDAERLSGEPDSNDVVEREETACSDTACSDTASENVTMEAIAPVEDASRPDANFLVDNEFAGEESACEPVVAPEHGPHAAASAGEVGQAETQGIDLGPAEPSQTDGTSAQESHAERPAVMEEAVEDDSSSDDLSIVAEFKPEWEVDELPWPDICQEIEGRVAAELQSSLESIINACAARGVRTVVLTSAQTGLGRTTMAMCFAREAARLGKSVALVDFDHERPALLERVGIDFETGIESLRESGVTLESICVSATREGISLFPASNPFDPTQCAEPEVRQLLCTAETHHDLVLVDATREVADLLVGLSGIPKLSVVMVSSDDTREVTQAFLDWLTDKQAWTLGVIENFAA